MPQQVRNHDQQPCINTTDFVSLTTTYSQASSKYNDFKNDFEFQSLRQELLDNDNHFDTV